MRLRLVAAPVQAGRVAAGAEGAGSERSGGCGQGGRRARARVRALMQSGGRGDGADGISPWGVPAQLSCCIRRPVQERRLVAAPIGNRVVTWPPRRHAGRRPRPSRARNAQYSFAPPPSSLETAYKLAHTHTHTHAHTHTHTHTHQIHTCVRALVAHLGRKHRRAHRRHTAHQPQRLRARSEPAPRPTNPRNHPPPRHSLITAYRADAPHRQKSCARPKPASMRVRALALSPPTLAANMAALIASTLPTSTRSPSSCPPAGSAALTARM